MALASSPGYGIGGVPRVNLMPRAEIERRERSVLLTRWGWGLIGALAVVVLAIGAAFWMQLTAESKLAAANARTTSLLGEIAALADVREAVALDAELTDFRSQAMAADLKWGALVQPIEEILPDDASLSGFTLSAGAIPVGEDPALEVGAAGSYTIASVTPLDVVKTSRDARGLPGVLMADTWEMTSSGGMEARLYEYILQVTIDQSVYTGEYATEAAE
jgi:hypothetical protein